MKSFTFLKLGGQQKMLKFDLNSIGDEDEYVFKNIYAIKRQSF